jgi:lycopene cyclase domain-containing protein
VLRLTYLLVLVACVLGTLPLEFVFGARVYRRWSRALLALLPVAAAFVVWDYLAVRAGWWWFDARYLTGLFVGGLPIEELLFFLVIPVCGILTFEAVRRLRPEWAKGSSLAAPAPASQARPDKS